jgi:hypothetical protein
MRHSIVSTHRSWFIFLALAAVALSTLACGFEGGAFGSTPTPGASGSTVPAVSNAAPQVAITAVAGMTQEPGPAEAILITSPQPGQGARGSLKVEGLADASLAAQLNVLIRDARGTVIATARPAAQAPSDQRSAFSAEVIVPADTPRQTGRVQVYASLPGSNGVTHLASVDVELNGDAKASVPIDPQTPEAIAMIFPSPNATVKGVVKVAAATMLGPKIVIEVHDANNQTVGRVEQTVELTAGVPTQVMAEVPIQVSTAGPGYVLVYAVNARDGATEHLSSVEVNLTP